MKVMRITEFGKPLALMEVENPSPKENEVVVKVEAAGVCHTDLHLVSGSYDLGEGRFLSMRDRGIRLPVTPGHELAGTIAEQGGSFDGPAKVGDRVVVYPWIGCGVCRKCISGAENLCEGRPASLGFFRDGGYAEYVLVPDGRYAVKSEGIEPEQGATLTCSGLTAYNSLKKCRLMTDDLLVIIGAGGLGTLCIQLAKKLSGARIAVLDVEESKLELATKLGADLTINTSNLSKSEIVSRLRNSNSGRGADAVVDFVSNGATASLGFDLLGRGGRLVLVGLFGGAVQFSLPYFPTRGAEVIGAFTGTLRDLVEMIGLTRRGVITPVIAGKFKLTEANDVLEKLRRKEILGRAVLAP